MDDYELERILVEAHMEELEEKRRQEADLTEDVVPPAAEPKNQRERQHKAKGWGRVVGILIDLLFILALLLSFLFSQSSDPDKALFGYRYYFVLTGSMEPELPIGSLVLVKLTDPMTIQIGDDVTVSSGDARHEIITHRVIEIMEDYNGSGERGFITKGIAKELPDEDIRMAEDVIGVVTVCIPYLGYIVAFLQDNIVPIAVGIVVLTALMFYLGKVWKSDGEEKTGTRVAGGKKKERS